MATVPESPAALLAALTLAEAAATEEAELKGVDVPAVNPEAPPLPRLRSKENGGDTARQREEPPKGCVTDMGRYIWRYFYNIDTEGEGRSIQVPDKHFPIHDGIIGTKDWDEDCEVLRPYFTRFEVVKRPGIHFGKGEFMDLVVGATCVGQFRQNRFLAQLVLVLTREQIAIHVFEQAAVGRETLHLFIKPKDEPEKDWRPRVPKDAVIVKQQGVAARVSAFLRTVCRRYNEISWVGHEIGAALGTLHSMYGADTKPDLPMMAVCLDTASDLFSHQFSSYCVIALNRGIVTDLDFKDCGAVARRYAPVYAIYVAFTKGAK